MRGKSKRRDVFRHLKINTMSVRLINTIRLFQTVGIIESSCINNDRIVKIENSGVRRVNGTDNGVDKEKVHGKVVAISWRERNLELMTEKRRGSQWSYLTVSGCQ